MKKILKIIFTFILLIVLTSGCTKNKDINDNDESKNNISSKVFEDNKIDEIKFTNILLVRHKDVSNLKADYTNESETKIYVKSIYIKINDKKNNKILEFTEYVDKELNQNDKFSINFSTDIDLSQSSKIIFEIRK